MINEQPSPIVRTIQQKINELADTIHATDDFYKDRKKTITEQLQEIKRLASDLNVDNIQVRTMIIECFSDTGVSLSWIRKLLQEHLRSTKQTGNDSLKQQ